MISYTPIINKISYNGYQIGILRLDLIHSEISGNKWFKLKYNLEQAKKGNKNTIITFGGAFSNHIAATAVASKLAGFKCIGIIRGEERIRQQPYSVFCPTKWNGIIICQAEMNTYKKTTAVIYNV
jgi:1-aminocyclopropane-1-carboxylate deaminase